MQHYDVIVVGSGGAGMMSAIVSARGGKKVLLLEKLSKIASKLKASGGGRCNITNTLSNDEFMKNFGRDGRFLQDMLEVLDSLALREFLNSIGVETHAPDGFRVFPTSHNSATIIEAFEKELSRVGVSILCDQEVIEVLEKEGCVYGVKTKTQTFFAQNVVIATGGKGFSKLGTTGDGYRFAQELGHNITPLFAAMLPLVAKESWTEKLRADTVAKATLRVDLKKHKKLKARGDLIFTKKGIRGPVVLDFAREITPLVQKYGEVPLVINMAKGMDEDKLYNFLKQQPQTQSVLEVLQSVFATSVAEVLCELAKVDGEVPFSKLKGESKANLLKIATATPLSIVGDDGFEKAMVTRGGISLKEVDPKTMQSKLVKGLYFCGEVLNIDGPCGGYNLQFCFSSGYLCGKSIVKEKEYE